MIQTFLALTIVALAVGKSGYSIYKALTTKEKSLCGGCSSCELKNEIRKKQSFGALASKVPGNKFFSAQSLQYQPKNQRIHRFG